MALREVSTSRILGAWGLWCCSRLRDFSSRLSPAPSSPEPRPPCLRLRLRLQRIRRTQRATARRPCCSSISGLGPRPSTRRERRTTCATRSARRPSQHPRRPPPSGAGPASDVRTFEIRSPSPRGRSVSPQDRPRTFATRSTSRRPCCRSARIPAAFRFSVPTPCRPDVPKHRAASSWQTASESPPTTSADSLAARSGPPKRSDDQPTAQQSPIGSSQLSGPHVDGYKNPSTQVGKSPQIILGSQSSGGHAPMGSSQFAGPQPLG